MLPRQILECSGSRDVSPSSRMFLTSCPLVEARGARSTEPSVWRVRTSTLPLRARRPGETICRGRCRRRLLRGSSSRGRARRCRGDASERGAERGASRRRSIIPSSIARGSGARWVSAMKLMSGVTSSGGEDARSPSFAGPLVDKVLPSCRCESLREPLNAFDTTHSISRAWPGYWSRCHRRRRLPSAARVRDDCDRERLGIDGVDGERLAVAYPSLLEPGRAAARARARPARRPHRRAVDVTGYQRPPASSCAASARGRPRHVQRARRRRDAARARRSAGCASARASTSSARCASAIGSAATGSPATSTAPASSPRAATAARTSCSSSARRAALLRYIVEKGSIAVAGVIAHRQRRRCRDVLGRDHPAHARPRRRSASSRSAIA